MQNQEIDTLKTFLSTSTNESLLAALEEADDRGNTLLSLMAESGNATAIQMLLEVLPDPKLSAFNRKNKKGETPLIVAVKKGHFIAVQTLLEGLASKQERLAAIHEPDNDGWSALSWAAEYGRIGIVQAFCNLGANYALEQPYKIIKEIGHMLGLTVKIPACRNSENIEVRTEGNISLHSLGLLAEVTKEYLQTIPPENHKRKQAFELASNALAQAARYALQNQPDMEEAMLNAFKVDPFQCMFVSSGWAEHRIALAFYKDYLIMINRGDGRGPGPNYTKIYKIPEPNKERIDAQFIKALTNLDLSLDQRNLEAHIATIVDINAPFTALTTKAQRHGTCSFVNPKGFVESILFIDEYERISEPVLDEAANKIAQKAFIKLAAQHARTEYKKFTNFVRNEGVKRLLQYQNSCTTRTEALVGVGLAKEIITHHYGQYRPGESNLRLSKRQQEIERILTILNGFSGDKDLFAALNPGTENFFLAAIKAGIKNVRVGITLLRLHTANTNVKHINEALAWAINDKRSEPILQVLYGLHSLATPKEKIAVLTTNNLLGNILKMDNPEKVKQIFHNFEGEMKLEFKSMLANYEDLLNDALQFHREKGNISMCQLLIDYGTLYVSDSRSTPWVVQSAHRSEKEKKEPEDAQPFKRPELGSN